MCCYLQRNEKGQQYCVLFAISVLSKTRFLKKALRLEMELILQFCTTFAYFTSATYLCRHFVNAHNVTSFTVQRYFVRLLDTGPAALKHSRGLRKQYNQ